ncbi:DUF72 domain-containing protein [Chitinasiproducens palmae]|uniref:Uncharacterized conserved protein YecE, DUF72 family n=1 Tax=Chitinasiproducens palmae TaxID=1770053 RepID=A0A1H2PMV0_9BURK|nr:Uncharacterized conserved protein YecE, DUF72 family [Chitinasiproducens palmae]
MSTAASGGPADIAGFDAPASPSVLIGTASWSDRSLIASKRFYPAGVNSPEARLRYYASQFPLVEIDTSYYALPTVASATQWAARTPPGFTFNIKAFRLFTGHRTQSAVLPKAIREKLPAQSDWVYKLMPVTAREALWEAFREALAPLTAADKLGAVHFQFAPTVVRSDRALAHLDHVAARLPGLTIAVEFRHASWFATAQARADTLDFLAERGFVNVVVDSPQGFQNSVPSVWEATSPELALVRLHGRNTSTWNLRGATSASQRFNYDYSDEELAVMAERVAQLAARAKRTHVVFNNNWEDQGQRNAKTLKGLLGGDVIRWA